MLVSTILSTSLLATAAIAFQGTSPFLIFSTSRLPGSGEPSREIASTADVNADFAKAVKQCPSDVYIFAYQPEISADDLASTDGLQWILRKGHSYNNLAVPEVVGSGLDQAAAVELLKTKCSASSSGSPITQKNGIPSHPSSFPQIIQVELERPAAHDDARRSSVARNRDFLAGVVDSIGDRSHTIIYHGSPPPPSSYSDEVEHSAAQDLHMDLKRGADGRLRKRQSDGNWAPSAGLFERYNFLGPGIFMGIIAFLILFVIGHQGISALAGVKVSYAAFSKEMGPSAQKKQQ